MPDIVFDEHTANLGLPLPNVQNSQAADVERIAQSFDLLDTACGALRLKDAELAQAAQSAQSAATAAKSAADAAQGAADTAQASASNAQSAADAAQNAADTAQGTASAAIPKSGARGTLAGSEAAGSLTGSQTITADSADCICLNTSGACELTFTAASAEIRAIKTLSLHAEADSTLSISGAVWANAGDAPEWGTAGNYLVLVAHFVGGRVILTVCDNTQG